jgi:predicted ATPase
VTTFLEGRRKRRAEAAAATVAAATAPSAPTVGPAEPAAADAGAGAAASAGAPALLARAAPRAIRTPDQRVRVFVSSTLNELAVERGAVRDAVESLRLTPVMFEAGARAHPPRDLYRAYLDQSDVFVGVYAARYGWVAPGEDVSGLEDEYLRSGDRPKLIYVKQVEGEREARLEGLLDRVRADDRVSYRPFRDAAELRDLVADDLAALLTERFDHAEAGPDARDPAPVPVVWGPLFGREAEVEGVLALLADPAVRLVTLLGPGGIGKSRLALEVAHRLKSAGDAPVAFVGLQAVGRPEQVAPAVVAALGLRGVDERDAAEVVGAYLASRRVLLLIDNFEQVVAAAPLLSRWLERCPGLRMLVTSRAPLRLATERCVSVGPLPLPTVAVGGDALAVARANPAVALFAWRARASDPTFEVTEANAGALVALVRALDGWPLALLLAAARAGHLTPGQLLERLEAHGLEALGAGIRDLPERQRTLRTTIDWSIGLLSEPARALLRTLSAFVGGATLEAIEHVHATLRPADAAAVVDALGELCDHSLVARVVTALEPRYVPYGLVRDVARDLLVEAGEQDAARSAHAAWYRGLAERIGPSVFDGSLPSVARLRLEDGNVDAALRTSLERDDVAAAAAMARSLWLFWWIEGLAEEHLPWMEALLVRTDLDDGARRRLLLAAAALAVQLRDMARASRWLDAAGEAFQAVDDPEGTVLIGLGRSVACAWSGDLDATVAEAERARGVAAAIGWSWAESFACVMLARAALGRRAVDDAVRWGEEAARLQQRAGDVQSEGWARLCLAVAHALAGRARRAHAELGVAIGYYDALAYHGAATFALEVAAFQAALAGAPERAARLAGAAATAKRSFGAASFEPEASIVAAELAALRSVAHDDPALAQAWTEGEGVPLDVALRYAAAEGGLGA